MNVAKLPPRVQRLAALLAVELSVQTGAEADQALKIQQKILNACEEVLPAPEPSPERDRVGGDE